MFISFPDTLAFDRRGCSGLQWRKIPASLLCMETNIITCNTCLDTGWDDFFNSACGDCGAALATPEAIIEAKSARAAAQAVVDTHVAKRAELVTWLAAQDWEFPQSLAAQYTKKGDLSPKQWAAAEKMFAKATDPTAPPRWTKVGETWGVRALGAKTGDTVTVTNKAGKSSEVKLGQALGNDTFAPFEETIELADGTYEIEVDGELVKYKVQTSRAPGGKQYAKVKTAYGWEYAGRDPLKSIAEGAALLEDTQSELATAIEEFRARFGIGKTANVALPSSGTNDLAFWNVTVKNVYLTVGGSGRTTQPASTQLSVLKRMAEMTEDEVTAAMALYGQELGYCGRCGSELTLDISREMGLGQKCAAKRL